MDIRDAIINEDRELRCSCGKVLGLNKDHDIINYKGTIYFQFLKFCTGAKCQIVSQYCVDITIDSREVFIFPYKECKKVKDEQIKVKEEE